MRTNVAALVLLLAACGEDDPYSGAEAFERCAWMDPYSCEGDLVCGAANICTVRDCETDRDCPGDLAVCREVAPGLGNECVFECDDDSSCEEQGLPDVSCILPLSTSELMICGE